MGTLLETLISTGGLTQDLLAEEIGSSRPAVGKWVRGEAVPHAPMAKKLAQRLGYEGDPYDLFKPEPEPEQTTQEQIAMDYLKTLDRRQLLALLATLPQLKDVDFSQLGAGAQPPDEFLSQCNAAISGCYELMRNGSMAAIDNILVQFLPRLSGLASNPSEFQEVAASLAVQSKVLQAFMETRRGNFTARKLLCLEAVKFGELSGDNIALVSALNIQGDTYIYCYRQPKRAIPIFEEALSKGNSDTLTKHGVLYANLSIAYAQLGDEDRARDFIGQARKFRGTLEPSALDRYDGRVFSYLAEHFPGKDYAQRAYEAFEQSLDTSSPEGIGYHSQTLIHKANACLFLGKLDEYTVCLENGMQIALRINSEELQSKATTTYGKAEHWVNERRYIELGRLF
jgi:transcriptional regulator with XRE-family HTH domain